MQQLRKGYIFEGKYRIEGELGRGGFGMVYQAHQIGMERAVALKVLNPDMSAQAARTARERFMREVRIISKLRHPNTVTIHDFGETMEGMVYMVLEFVDGETLKDRLRRQGAMEESRAVHVALQVARSLSEAHRHGIIHRDLKPANIMLTELGSDPDYVKVLDFGVARLRSADPAAELTSHGLPPGERELIGTPRYMSPEQVRGEELTGASDVYSLGLILYEMLTGEAAVQGDTTMALITQQISPEPLRMLQLQSIHPHLQHILRHATEKRLDARYRTVDILAQELEQAADALRRPQQSFRSAGQEEFLIGNHYDQAYDSMRQSWGHQSQMGWGPPLDPAAMNRQSGHFGYAQPQPQRHPTMPPGAEHIFGQAGGWGMPTGAHQAVAPMGSPTGGYGAVQGHDPHGAAMSAQFGAMPQQGWGDPSMSAEPPTTPHMQALSARQQAVPAPNIRESTLARIAADLPPPPVDLRSEFAPELPQPQQPNLDSAAPVVSRTTMGTRAVPAMRPKDEDTLGFAIALASTLIVGLLMLASFYLAFITVGAALILLFQGPLRLIFAVIATLLIPAVPLVAEGGRRERFQVVYNNLQRARKALTVGMIGSLGSFILVSIVFPSVIIRELRSDPNWFMGVNRPGQEPPAPTLNRAISGQVADLIEESSKQFGTYKAPNDPPPVVVPTGPPAPTRPQSMTDEERQREIERLTPKGPAPTRNRTAPTRPKDEPDDKDKDKPKPDRSGRAPRPGKEDAPDKPAKPSRDEEGGDYVKW
jgi:serine/threonine protein kinase